MRLDIQNYSEKDSAVYWLFDRYPALSVFFFIQNIVHTGGT